MATTEKIQLTIVGLGVVGASAGLALRRHAERVAVTGHDKDPAAANQARQMGAVDRTESNLIRAVRGADRILLAVPAREVRETLGYIKEDLRHGCVIVDTASVKQAVLAWAAETLPSNVHLVGGHPILVTESQDTSAARADMFEGKTFCLTADVQTPAEALQAATDLVAALGAKAFFLDAPEHDGLAAAVEHLPTVLAGALAGAASESVSWKEMRKLAGSQFYSGTYLVEADAQAAAEACLANGAKTIRWIDNLVAELGRWRQRLATGDEEGLAAAFEAAREATILWTRAQAAGDWSEGPAPELPTMGSQFRRMLGFGGRDFRDVPKSKGK